MRNLKQIKKEIRVQRNAHNKRSAPKSDKDSKRLTMRTERLQQG